MYVCLCKAVTDHQIHDAVAEGCDTMRGLQRELGVASCCGKCAPCAREVLNDALREQQFKQSLPAQPQLYVVNGAGTAA
ncbi:MAG: bacterioferritin-associated ferredoxin [Oleiphilaceae bacterium]|nr:bacterioferritin-associated ferredoxin [Oleiphilaceae bacterium]